MLTQRRQFLMGVTTLGAAGFTSVGLSVWGKEPSQVAVDEKAKPKNAGQDENEVSPVEDLMREHGVLKRVLLIYEEGLRRLDAKQEVPLKALGDGARIIRSFIEDYHQAARVTLSPRADSRQEGVPDMIACMIRTHAPAATIPPATDRQSATACRAARLRELAALFLRLGLTAFGGPAAHIALMEDEVVARRRWLSRFLKVGSVLFGSGYVLLAFLRADLVERWHRLTEAQLLDAVAVGQVTPGPVFTTATFLGYVPDGPRGGVVAALGIFLPTFFFVAISGPLVPRLRRSAVAGDVLDGVNVGSLALMAMVRGIHRAQSSRPAWCSWRTRKPSPSYLRGCELRRPVRSRGR